MKLSNPEYLDKIKTLSEEEKERLLSRMGGKLPRRLEKDKVSVDLALAIQLEIEDGNLQEWRKKMHAIKEKDSAGKKAKGKKVEDKPAAKTPAIKKTAEVKVEVVSATKAKPKTAKAKS
ncbi:hypothetical protein [Methyloradius palustris]|uniref:Uncharacterized protein n=1 Tax=Methyloradius palustris TaxID=2778876 RepID=A0A8D5G6L9_9PROT|nr:hypothetical protein [Methyloradius palustris]BCM24127.1 hypothetical protein ZMTM_03860 [Methyloradius palustris]